MLRTSWVRLFFLFMEYFPTLLSFGFGGGACLGIMNLIPWLHSVKWAFTRAQEYQGVKVTCYLAVFLCGCILFEPIRLIFLGLIGLDLLMMDSIESTLGQEGPLSRGVVFGYTTNYNIEMMWYITTFASHHSMKGVISIKSPFISKI